MEDCEGRAQPINTILEDFLSYFEADGVEKKAQNVKHVIWKVKVIIHSFEASAISELNLGLATESEAWRLTSDFIWWFLYGFACSCVHET